nr:uncharacterized protein LOC128688203 [Cherax quadricarinatus]
MGVSPPVGGVIGRGGFGTVKVGRHKGVKVGVKVLRGGRAAASSQREAHALSLPPHAHLASTHALVTPSTTTGYACITWGVTCLNNIKEKNQIVSYEAAAAMFSLPVEDVVRWAGDAAGGAWREAWVGGVVSELCTPLTLLTLINQPDYELTIRTKIRWIHWTQVVAIVAVFTGVKVGVKVLRGGRAAASSQREAHALSLPPHAHLASTHALVTPSTTTGYACITWGVTCLNNIKEKNQIVSYEAAAAMFSLPVEDVVRWAGDAREEHGGRPG